MAAGGGGMGADAGCGGEGGWPRRPASAHGPAADETLAEWEARIGAEMAWRCAHMQWDQDEWMVVQGRKEERRYKEAECGAVDKARRTAGACGGLAAAAGLFLAVAPTGADLWWSLLAAAGLAAGVAGMAAAAKRWSLRREWEYERQRWEPRDRVPLLPSEVRMLRSMAGLAPNG